MGQIIRDLGMTMLVGLVVYTLYAARSARSSVTSAPAADESNIFTSARQNATEIVSELPPLGFTVFPWMP